MEQFTTSDNRKRISSRNVEDPDGYWSLTSLNIAEMISAFLLFWPCDTGVKIYLLIYLLTTARRQRNTAKSVIDWKVNGTTFKQTTSCD